MYVLRDIKRWSIASPTRSMRIMTVGGLSDTRRYQLTWMHMRCCSQYNRTKQYIRVPYHRMKSRLRKTALAGTCKAKACSLLGNTIEACDRSFL